MGVAVVDPEHRVGVVQQTLAEAANRGLRVRYTLVSHPEHPLEGWLQRLAEQATRTADGRTSSLAPRLSATTCR